MCGEGRWSVSDVDFVPLCVRACERSTALIYGIATSHHAYSGVIDTLGVAPGTVVLSPLGGKALGAVVLTVLFGLRVFYVHWVGSSAKGGSGVKTR